MAVRVAALNYTLYMIMQGIGHERYKCLDGEECKFMEVLSQAIDAKFEFLLSNDGGFDGFQIEGGNWNGNMKLLQQNKADIAPYMTYGYERWKVGIPSCPTHLTRIVFANLNPKPLSNAYAFFFTFELSAWWCILASVLLCSCVLAILLLRHNNQKFKLVSFFLESYVSSVEMIFGMRSFEKIRGSKSAELFCTFVSLSMRILTFCFTAVFLAFLMAPLERPKIETYKQLGKAAAFDQVKVTVHGASFIRFMLLNAPNGTMKTLGDNIKKHSGDSKMVGKIYMEIIGDGYTIID